MTDMPDFDDIDDSCPNCDGTGWVDSCFEDTCVCLDPPCHRTRCDWCTPRGERPVPPIDADHGGNRPEAPVGPLLEIMERDR